MNIRDNLSVAFTSIKANRLRTVLTALIIAIGITALVGIINSIVDKKCINKKFQKKSFIDVVLCLICKTHSLINF